MLLQDLMESRDPLLLWNGPFILWNIPAMMGIERMVSYMLGEHGTLSCQLALLWDILEACILHAHTGIYSTCNPPTTVH